MLRIVAFLLLVSNVALADTSPGVDLRADLAHRQVRSLRIAGFTLMAVGLASTIGGAVGFYRVNPNGENPDDFTAFGATASTVVLGESMFGTGIGLVSASGALGRDSNEIPSGNGARTAGIALTAIGGALTLVSLGFTILTARCNPYSDGDLCALPAIVGMGTGALAGIPLGIGVGALAVGVGREHQRVIIDSIGPRSMPNGAGVGISGRF
jgi:hypothetical protein